MPEIAGVNVILKYQFPASNSWGTDDNDCV